MGRIAKTPSVADIAKTASVGKASGKAQGRKKDKRSLATEEKIKQSLLEMLYEMRISQVNVSALSEKAGITRATFYQHYGNLDDVLEEIVADVVANVGDVPIGMCAACSDTASPDRVRVWEGIPFCHLLSSGNPYRVLLEDSSIAERVIEGIVDAGLDVSMSCLKELYPDTSVTRQQLRYYNIFRMSGCLAAAKAARRNGYDWSMMQPTLDAAIAAAFSTLR